METLIQCNTLIEVLFEKYCNLKFWQKFELLLINNIFYSSKNPQFLAFCIKRD